MKYVIIIFVDVLFINNFCSFCSLLLSQIKLANIQTKVLPSVHSPTKTFVDLKENNNRVETFFKVILELLKSFFIFVHNITQTSLNHSKINFNV